LNFKNDFTWDLSLAGDFISENSLEIFYRWQAIRQMSIRKKWNHKFSLVKKKISLTIVYMECNLFFTRTNWHVTRYSQGDSRV